MNTIEETKLDG